jgi:hypothetical protein
MKMTISPNWIGRPYFIYSNDFIYKSAGVKLMHYLCHLINEAGYRAYVTPCITSPILNTPILNNEVIDYYKSRNIEPIAIYGERIDGNPLNLRSVVRYLGNYLNHFNDIVSYNKNDMILSYSVGMNNISDEEVVLHIPLVDTNIYKYSDEKILRNGSLVYAGKYVDVHGGELLPEHKNLYQITRNANSETPNELKKLFQNSEVLYVYENTALTIEAILCGCPVVLVPNKFFDKIIGGHEYKKLGFAWGLETEELERAKNTLLDAKNNYQYLISQVPIQLNIFLNKSQLLPLNEFEQPFCVASTSSIINYRLSNIDSIKLKWLKQKLLGFFLILNVLIFVFIEFGLIKIIKKILQNRNRQELKRLFVKYYFNLYEKLP